MGHTLATLTDGTALHSSEHARIDVKGLTADSRAVQQGFVFAALKGSATDGRKFIPKAIEAGASAILTDTAPGDVPSNVAFLLDDNPRQRLAEMAARLFPRQPDNIVAVTGTAGKTSVATFARQLFSALGCHAASLGTVGVQIGEELKYGNLTTPDPVTLHQILDEIAGEGVTHLAMEASSHGLHQYRLDGVKLRAAGFTNLGRDHLDYHGTMDAYLTAKLRLFEDLLPPDGTAVFNADCDEAAAIASIVERRGLRAIPIGKAGTGIQIKDIRDNAFKQIVEIDGTLGSHNVSVPFVGRFQVMNALISAGLTVAAGCDPQDVFAAVETLKGAKGRLERIGMTESGANIIIDYAHKPDALREVLIALRPFTAGRLISVFGAGGDRDPGKRPIMGAVSKEFADVTIVTDDNPRTEDPATIRKAILDSAPSALEIGDRAEAIAHAASIAGRGDTILIAGKGHEPGQIIGTETIPFSDHDVAGEFVAHQS
ncbi:MAG: UDP-N-acetylmuramoyl-L-alanyl-D-glutamate--2,6-diaminopimelate ligase [Pseudomonadota bacterium]